MKKIIGLMILTALFAVAAFADIRLPDEPKRTPTPAATPQMGEKEAQMIIQISNEVTEPTLVISKNLIGQMPAAESAKLGIGSTQTIVGGLFLSLAFVFGGVLLARGKGNMPKAAIGIFAVAILGFAGSVVSANIAPPRNVPLNKNLFSKEMQGYAMSRGMVKFKVVDNSYGSDIRLLIPPDAPKPSKKGDE
ncbi:MAG TPA: hypothetical protein PKY59_07170 [Pyrinomonadaceae bacterium]|nr:hypothetical protein [Pyrinomonadaceae bacterium]